MVHQKITISVIGGHDISQEVEYLAQNVGKIIASVGGILVCGGLDGVMMESARGCKAAGGTTIGLLPGKDKADANEFIDIALPTTIGYARNAMVAAAADIIIALPGSHGTSCEISYGFVYKRPMIDLGGWKRDGMIQIESIDDLKSTLEELIEKIKQGRHAGAA